MNFPEKLLRIAVSRWTERICFTLILAAAVSGNGYMWTVAGIAVALVIGTVIAGSIAPLREARHAARDFPHTPEYEAYVRRKEANEQNGGPRIELK